MNSIEAIELLKYIISTPSFSKEENEVANIILNILETNGFRVKRKGNNVWAKSTRFDDSKPTILLDAHLDTVKPNGNWETDPFTPTVKDGKLIGLGSNDTGGSIVSMLTTFINLANTNQAYNLIFSGSAEEENTGKNGIQSIIGDLGKIDLAIVGEPTGMNPAIAEKGLMVLDCVAKGISGHAARNEGVNAIYEAINDINWIKNYEFEKKSEFLGPVKMTVTGIEAGTLHNVVPAECKFMIDVRVNEKYSNQEVYNIINDNIKSETIPRSFSLNSSSINIQHPFVQRCLSLGLEPYGSPTTSNQAVMPFTSVKMGPGDSARSHTANEYIYLKEIDKGIEIFYELLNGINL